MIGAIIGDIIGSTYEIHNVKTEAFELFPEGSKFTDDSVLTVAVANKILNSEKSSVNNRVAYAMWYKQYYKRYPNAGFGQMFSQWALSEKLYIQRSYGNGASMRVSAIGHAFDSVEKIIDEVNASCFYTHNNSEAKKGAQAVAIAVFMAKQQTEKEEIKKYIEQKYRYKFCPLDELREEYVFDSRTSYSVPPALEAFFESCSYEDAIRKAISIGGDSDTIACIAGGVAQAYYQHIPQKIYERGMGIIDVGLRQTIESFEEKYNIKH